MVGHLPMYCNRVCNGLDWSRGKLTKSRFILPEVVDMLKKITNLFPKQLLPILVVFI